MVILEKIVAEKITENPLKNEIQEIKGPNIRDRIKSSENAEGSKINYEPIYKQVESKANTDSEEKSEEKYVAESIKEINTRNKELEGTTHPVTEVTFRRKEVETPEGTKEGVFPEFQSKFDVQLPEDLEKASDSKQFDHCNEQLKEAVKTDSELKETFTKDELEQIENKDTPDGYTWHHAEDTGKMELVDSEIHAKTGHTGGKVIWGGGNEYR